MPGKVVEFLERGAFVCNITGTAMHSVAIDEGHKMLVTVVVRPTKQYVDRVLYYFSTCTHALDQQRKQLGLGFRDNNSTYTILDCTPAGQRVEENVRTIKTKLEGCLATTGEQRLTSFSGKQATPEQSRDIGLSHFQARIRYFIVRDPTAEVPQRQNMLPHFVPKRLQKKIKKRDKERKIVNKCMRRQMAYNAHVWATENLIDEQYLELPQAICDQNGAPHKGQKSYTTKWLEKRYESIILNNIHLGGSQTP